MVTCGRKATTIKIWKSRFKSWYYSKLLKNLESDHSVFTVQDNKLKVKSDSSDIRFIVKGIPVLGEHLTVFITASGDPVRTFPSEYARLMVLSTGHNGLPLPGRITNHFNEKNRFASFINQKDFTSGFFLSGLDTNTIEVEILIESSEPVWISGLEAYSFPDVVCREFQNGLVLANPCDLPVDLNMKELFPMQTFKRLEGTQNQDLEVNNGMPVGDILRLDKKDAIFLAKRKKNPGSP